MGVEGQGACLELRKHLTRVFFKYFRIEKVIPYGKLGETIGEPERKKYMWVIM